MPRDRGSIIITMHNYYPLLICGAIIGVLTVIFGLAFIFMKDKKAAIGFDRHMKDSEVALRLLKYAKPYWPQFVLVLVLMVLSISDAVISPIVIGRATDLFKDPAFDMNHLWLIVGEYAGIILATIIGGYFQAIILQKTGQRIISNIREDLFVHLESYSHNQLHKIPVGTLVTRLTNDINAVSVLFTNILVNLIKNVFVILGIVIAMTALNYTLTLVVLSVVPFVALFAIIFRKFARRAHRHNKDANTDLNIYLSENLSGMKIIQVFNREDRKMEEFEEKNQRLKKARFEQLLVFGIFRPVIYILYLISVLMVFYFSGKNYIDGAVWFGQVITADVVVSFYMFIGRFFDPIQVLAEQFNRLQSAFASGEKIFAIMDTPTDLTDDEGAIELKEVKGAIEFKDVWFAYVPGVWILKGVSFKIEAGQTVAFVGATGSGKTTILSLLCRNYDIQKGEILLDGVNIRKYTLASLRKHFGQMLQDVFLFSGTIRSNLALREESFTDEDIEKACRYVNADQFIDKLPNGLDEEVRERGNNFSAGQRQLISFARTVLHKPEVLILDEATANIDTETEVLIQDSLEKMMNIGTMLIVAHRLSTVQHADKIIVVSHGELVESGTHAELIEKKGAYYALYEMQYHKERLRKEGN